MGLTDRTRSFLSELRQRKVFRAASIYLVMMWTASLGVAELFPAFGLPEWAVRLFVVAAIIGFPVVVVGAWIFEITAEGVLLDRAARARRRAGTSEPTEISPLTTMWAHPQRMVVSWRDDAGTHEKGFESDFVMGRDVAADLQIDDGRISRLHARVSFERGRWWIEDLSSRNGTIVDGALITAQTPLGESAQVCLYQGAPVLHLRICESQPATRGFHPGKRTPPHGANRDERR